MQAHATMPAQETATSPFTPVRRGVFFSFAILLGYFLFCIFIQASTHAWTVPLLSYPDEPAHFVGSVMVRDYLGSGLHSGPFAFADNYYRHYPFFAVGYWPPLFYAITGLWFLIVGVGKFQALLLTAATTAGSAYLVCAIVRRRSGVVAGFCAGLIYLTLPEVQRWTCAVMLDEMVAFFSLAAAAFLIVYLERPGFGASAGFAVCAACATLTKYSGLYVCVVPFVAIICLRRFELLRKLHLLVQPVILALLIGPWAIWTAHLAMVGAGRDPIPMAVRLSTFPLQPFTFFPFVLSLVIVAGLWALALNPRARGIDALVMFLLGTGVVGFLILSPVEAERRYLLPAAGALIVLSTAGWTALIDVVERRTPTWTNAAKRLAVGVSILLAALHVLDFPKTEDMPIAAVVASITRNPEWTGKRIVVAPDFEGPMIAEFAIQDHRRPGYILERPGKLFTACSWFGTHCQSHLKTPSEMMAFLEKDPVDLMIWHEPPRPPLQPYEDLMRGMFAQCSKWRRTDSFGDTGDLGAWRVYRYVAGATRSCNAGVQ